MKQYRTRIEKARQLRADGVHLRDIAAQLNTTVATVKNWIQKSPSMRRGGKR